MGKLKRRNSVYPSSLTVGAATRLSFDPDALAIHNAFTLANYELTAAKEARRTLAVDRGVGKVTEQLENEYTDWDFGCMALILYRKHGFDAEKIAELLSEIQSMTKEFLDEGMNYNDIWDLVRDEVGLDVERHY